MDRRALGVGRKRNAQAHRRPLRRYRAKIGECSVCRRLALAFERVDPQVERRAARQRGAFGGALIAEHARERRIEPFGIVAGDPRRRAGEVGCIEPCALLVTQRGGRKACAVGKARDCGGVELAFEAEHAEHDRARRVGAHHEGGRGLAPQRVVDEPRDRGAVAGAGKAVRQAPAP